MMTPERAQELQAAIGMLRAFRSLATFVKPELALAVPSAGGVVDMAIGFEPVAEAVLTGLAEVVSALEAHQDPEAAREALAAKMRAETQALIDREFPNG